MLPVSAVVHQPGATLNAPRYRSSRRNLRIEPRPLAPTPLFDALSPLQVQESLAVDRIITVINRASA
jgi:hypothetical protein